MAKRVLTIAFAGVALATSCAPALASKGQLSMLQDDSRLRGSGDAVRDATLDELDSLGVDVVKVLANWRMMAPDGVRARVARADRLDELAELADVRALRSRYRAGGRGPVRGEPSEGEQHLHPASLRLSNEVVVGRPRVR